MVDALEAWTDGGTPEFLITVRYHLPFHYSLH